MRLRIKALASLFLVSDLVTACSNIKTEALLPDLAPSERIACRLRGKVAFSFVNLDTGYAKEVFGVSAPEYLNQQIESAMNQESPIPACSPNASDSSGISISLDSIAYEKHGPGPEKTPSGGGVGLTYDSEFKITAITYFSILKGAEKRPGKIAYSGKIFTTDFNEILAANQVMIKKIGGFLKEKK